jgi:predicted enzyme related to lactoylglutathione lyase
MNTLASLVQSVPDLDAATAVYRAWLGVEPHTTTPYYVGFNAGGTEFGLSPARAGDPVSPVPYLSVDDIEEALARAVAAGAVHRFGPQPVGGGTTIATVTDPSGAVLGLIHHE